MKKQDRCFDLLSHNFKEITLHKILHNFKEITSHNFKEIALNCKCKWCNKTVMDIILEEEKKRNK